jgi:hypothetical protein
MRWRALLWNLVNDFLQLLAEQLLVHPDMYSIWWSVFPRPINGEYDRDQVPSVFQKRKHTLRPRLPECRGDSDKEPIKKGNPGLMFWFGLIC